MKKLAVLGVIALGGAVAARCLRRQDRGHIGDSVRRRIMQNMERMMASLPEDAPPKLVMTVLPRLAAQNDRIIAMLAEQNELLRRQVRAA